ncbi:MAG: ferrous iron transport protein A [Oscillospiraceae bacterium]|jgi:feoA family protein|nr:ferrous iron transport protein A [Oscillospiraceae bacterium]
MTLDKLPIGKPAVILTVGGEGNLRCHLLDMGLIPHTEVTVRKVAPLGDPIEIFLRGYTMTLRKEDASKIEVRPMEEI